MFAVNVSKKSCSGFKEPFLDLIYRKHNVRYLPLVHHIITRDNPGFIFPDGFTEKVKNLRELTAARNLFLLGELKAVLRELNAAGIEVVLLKGAMMQNLYPPGVRPFTDIDFLVKKTDASRIETELVRLGYQPDSPHVFSGDMHFTAERRFIKDGPIPVVMEPHWLLGPPYLYAARIPVSDLWRRAQTATISGIKTLNLSAEDALIHFCLHLFKHGRTGWYSFCDIIEWIHHNRTRINWECFLNRVSRCRLCLPVLESLKQTRPYLPVFLDPIMRRLESYRPGRYEYWDFHALRQKNEKKYSGIASILQFLKMPHADKMRFIRLKVFPAREFMCRRYPFLKSQPLFLAYVFRMLAIAEKTILLTARMILLFFRRR